MPASVFCLESLAPENVVYYTYTMMGQPITSVTEHKYLGVELDSKLTWNEHISAIITGKANSSRVPSGMVAQKNRKIGNSGVRK